MSTFRCKAVLEFESSRVDFFHISLHFSSDLLYFLPFYSSFSCSCAGFILPGPSRSSSLSFPVSLDSNTCLPIFPLLFPLHVPACRIIVISTRTISKFFHYILFRTLSFFVFPSIFEETLFPY